MRNDKVYIEMYVLIIVVVCPISDLYTRKQTHVHERTLS